MGSGVSCELVSCVIRRARGAASPVPQIRRREHFAGNEEEDGYGDASSFPDDLVGRGTVAWMDGWGIATCVL